MTVVSRLDLFRGYFERLDPAATRFRALRDELYVAPPGRSVGEQLAYRLQLAPRSAHLIVGSVGAGKTTQLVRATELLNATGDTRAVYVDVSRRHDLDKNITGVLLILAGLELARQLRNVSDPTVKATCEQFSRWAYGHAEFVPYNPGGEYEYDDSDDDREQGDYVHRPGVLTQPLPPLPSSIKERIAALKILTAAMPAEAQHFVILFDSWKPSSTDSFSDDETRCARVRSRSSSRAARKIGSSGGRSINTDRDSRTAVPRCSCCRPKPRRAWLATRPIL